MLKRRARWMAGRAIPVGAIELRQARAQSLRRGGDARHPFKLLGALRSSRLDIVPTGVDLLSGPLVDIGANQGDWTAAALTVVPAAQVLAVEPTPALASDLRLRFANQAGVEVVESAVSDRVGSQTFHLTEHSHNSSLQRPLDMNDLYGHGWEEVESIEVATVTLDVLLEGLSPSLVKIDVQGAEALVLRGGQDVLARCNAVLLEVTTRSHYVDDATFPELDRLMSSSGFRLAGLSAPFFGSDGTALWFDACYVSERVIRSR